MLYNTPLLDCFGGRVGIYKSWVHALIAIPRTLGLQACMHPPKGKRKESAISEKEKEGSTKGKGGPYKN